MILDGKRYEREEPSQNRLMKTRQVSTRMLAFPIANSRAVSGDGYWPEVTYHPLEGWGFVPIYYGHPANVNASTRRISSYNVYVSEQTFGGWVYPSETECGLSAWILTQAYWYDAGGAHYISGWYSTGTICPPEYSCENFRSTQAFFLGGFSIYGSFQGRSWYGNGCFPNIGPIHEIRVYP